MSTATCKLVTQGIAFNCLFPVIGGAKARVVIINREEIASITRDITNPLIITGITLKTGKMGFAYVGVASPNNSNQGTTDLVKKKFAEVYDHILNMIVFDATPTTKFQIENFDDVVAILERNYQGADGSSAFEVYGLDTGLVKQKVASDTENADTGGAYELSLGSSDNVKEPHLPANFFVTDYATTVTAVGVLLVAAA